MTFRLGARDSRLSRAQVKEVAQWIGQEFETVWVKTTGDLDRKTSLRTLGKTDFFTRELDQMLLKGELDVALHSAKDLPDPIPEGLEVIAITCGLDPRDSLVLREGETLASLPSFAKIATSSIRREEMVKKLRSDLSFIDLRGTIDERLSLLQRKEADGVVVAEAALIRLGFTHLNREILSGETTPLQGKLAVVARANDVAMLQVFRGVGFLEQERTLENFISGH